jgi:hypothetical protein
MAAGAAGGAERVEPAMSAPRLWAARLQQDPSGSEGVLRAAPASAAPPAPLPRPPTEAALLAAAARGSMKLRAVVDRGLGHLPDPRAVSPGGSLDALAALLSLLGHLSEDFLRQPIGEGRRTVAVLIKAGGRACVCHGLESACRQH